MPSRRRLLTGAGLSFVGLAGCLGARNTPSPTPTGAQNAGDGNAGNGTQTPGGSTPTLASSAFGRGESIPTKYTCSGESVSPPLTVDEVPDGTETFALVMDDPDAGERPYVHWLVWNVPVDVTEWPEGVPTDRTVDELGGAAQGTNSRGKIGYVGPCPPPGKGPHSYRFRLYALGTTLDLDPGANRGDLESAIEASDQHASTTLTGTFER